MRIRPTTLLLLISALVLPVVVAYVQWATVGLPALPSVPPPPDTATAQGFPAWLRVTHYVNFLFVILLVLLVNGITVQHIMPSGVLRPHTLTEGAKVEAGELTYPQPDGADQGIVAE